MEKGKRNGLETAQKQKQRAGHRMEEEDFFNIKKVEAGWWRSAQVGEQALSALSADAVTRTDLEVSNKGREAFILHGVLTPAECQQYIDISLSMGYEVSFLLHHPRLGLYF